VAAPWVPWVTIGGLAVTGFLTVGRGVYAWWWGDADVPVWIVGGMLLGGAVSLVWAMWGLFVVRRDRWTGYVAFRRAILVSLLVTQVFLFRIEEWSAVIGLLADLAVLGIIAAELSQMEAEAIGHAGPGARRRLQRGLRRIRPRPMAGTRAVTPAGRQSGMGCPAPPSGREPVGPDDCRRGCRGHARSARARPAHQLSRFDPNRSGSP